MSLSEGSNDRQLDVALRVQYAWALAERDVEAGWAVISTAADSAAGSLDEAEVWTVVADLADRRGDTRSAANAAEAAVRLARSRHDQFALARAIEVSAVVSAGEQADVCSERFEEARAIFAELGCVVDVARVDVRLAGYDEADRGRARALGAAEAARKFGARPVVRAAERVIRDLDSNASPPLSVVVIGSLSITRNGEPVARAAWQSKKARDLFKMLLARRGRPVPRDQAVERLWPGEEPGAVMNRLSVALATARAVLDPDKRFEADHFIAADGDAIKLVTDSIDIDVERFLALARTALHENRHGDSTVAATMLAASEAMCGGDVFEEDPYDDWYMPLREEMRATYISIAMSLADLRVGEGDFNDAIRLLLRVLEREPYDESAHRKLIELLVRGGRHGDARRRYEYYAARMRELDLQPVAFPR
jgi:DNA-binding SARP family transcriptional activator